MHIFRHILLSNYWWQKSDIWSQASYRYAILWEAFFDPSDSYFLFADLVGFYAHWTYMHIFHHIFISNYWWQRSDIWSQASYRYPISWEAFLDPSDSYFLFADFVDFYTHWTYILYMPIFSRIFLSNYWWQKSDIWSQASYRYPISWEAFFDPSDSYFLFAEEWGYHKWALAHSSSCCMWVTSLDSLSFSFLNRLRVEMLFHLDILSWFEPSSLCSYSLLLHASPRSIKYLNDLVKSD